MLFELNKRNVLLGSKRHDDVRKSNYYYAEDHASPAECANPHGRAIVLDGIGDSGICIKRPMPPLVRSRNCVLMEVKSLNSRLSAIWKVA
jgi:hypothetical protein